jgi:hypothetical protein
MRASVRRAMLPPMPNLPVRFPRPRRRPANYRQALLASLGVLAVFGAAFFAVDGKYLFPSAPPARTQTEAELYAGSIQLAPSRENRCRHMTFDNRSNRVFELGSVPCGAATAAEPEAPPQGSRLDRIRDAFRNH